MRIEVGAAGPGCTPLQRGRTAGRSLNGGPASGGKDVRDLVENEFKATQRLSGDCKVSSLPGAQPPWAVSTYYSTDQDEAVTGRAPFANTWRMLLPDHLKRLRYGLILSSEGVFLSEGD